MAESKFDTISGYVMNKSQRKNLYQRTAQYPLAYLESLIPKGLNHDQHIEYMHVMIALAAGLSLCWVYFIFYLNWDHPAAVYGYFSDGFISLCWVASFFFLRKKKINTAVFIIVVSSFSTLGFISFVFGKQMNLHHYLPVAAGALLLLQPRNKRWLAKSYGILGLFLYVFLEIYLPEQTLVGPPIESYITFLSSLLAGSFSYLAIMSYIAWSIRQTESMRLRVEFERKRSEDLLLNILPESVAKRLLDNEGQIADGFESVTVLFADIVNFSEISHTMQPIDLVTYLNQLFSQFDTMTIDHGLEKIKTIGDAYMVAGGIPQPRVDHAEAVMELGIAILNYIDTMKRPDGLPVEVRIGIHTGPVIAGVIGLKKFIYDLWGDTVNLASRLESNGLTNCIQISDVTYQLLKDRYPFEDRGIIDFKGCGPTRTWIFRAGQAGEGPLLGTDAETALEGKVLGFPERPKAVEQAS